MATKKPKLGDITVTVEHDSWDPRIYCYRTVKEKNWYSQEEELVQEELWSAYIMQEATCCGFPVIGDFSLESAITRKTLKPYIPEIAKVLIGQLKKKKYKYIDTYIPDTKEYSFERAVMVEAGFKPAVSLKSKHGKYTNTRWEWFSSTYKPKKAYAKTISADTVQS